MSAKTSDQETTGEKDHMKTTTICIVAITLCSANLFAQKTAQAPREAIIFTGATQEAPDAEVKIFSNLGSSTAAYFNQGYLVLGPSNTLGDPSQSIGLPFKPAKASHAQTLEAGIQWYSSGANQVRLSLYSDASGVPGTKLAGPITVKNLATFPACCAVAKATIPSTALTAGTQYWIVADTVATGTGDDFAGVWNAAGNQTQIASDLGGAGYTAFPPSNIPAGAVYGTIP